MPERGGSDAEELAYRLRQQEFLARFGVEALKQRELTPLLDAAVQITAAGLKSRFCKYAEYLAAENRLLIRAGIGWRDGVVGKTTLGAGLESAAGFALHTGEPVISNHLAEESRFRTPAVLVEHEVKRAINVLVPGGEKPSGILEVDSTDAGRFTEHDIAFMQGMANVLGTGIMRIKAEQAAARHDREVSQWQAKKMTVLGRNAATIAHDFNNILQAITGALDCTELLLAEQPQLRKLIAIALGAADRGTRMAAQLLAFSRPQRLEPRDVELNVVFSELASSFERILGPTITLRQNLEPDLPPVFVDVNELERALLNLIINARDAMPNGGNLLIETNRVTRGRTNATEAGSATLPAAHVRIVVRDTGTGMSPEVREQVFEPFFSTKPAGRGTGLGLAQVYGFVEQSRGEIKIDSVEGEGTTVTIVLPEIEKRR